MDEGIMKPKRARSLINKKLYPSDKEFLGVNLISTDFK